MGSDINVYNKISSGLNLKIEAFDSSKRYTKPHRHNKYLELVYFSKRSRLHFMDQEKYDISPPVIYIIQKNQVHHWQIDSVPVGFVIIIKEEFLENTLDKHINAQFFQLEMQKAFTLSIDPSLDALFQLASNLIKEQIKEHTSAIEGILKALLAKLLHYAPRINSSENNIVFHFKQLLQASPKNDVAHYAQLLHTSSQNLNAQCRREYGKTASQVIAQHIVQEAKRQLMYTDLSISEIAFASNFKDASHFIKYFKRFEGITPMQFKRTRA